MADPRSDFVYASEEDLLPIIKDHWTELDYQALMKDQQVILLGDTNHEQVGITGGLAKIIGDFGVAGATHLGVEFPRSRRYLDAISRFNDTGDISHVIGIAESTRNPVRLAKLFANANTAGLMVEII